MKKIFIRSYRKIFLLILVFVMFLSLSSEFFGAGKVAFAADLGPYVNVLDYGVTPDDASLDNIAAIKSAIDEVTDSTSPKYKKSIYFPAGVYYISPSNRNYLLLKSNLHITGDKNAIIKVKDNAGDYDYIFRPVTTAAVVNNVSISNVTIDQNGANNTTSDVIHGSDGKGTRQMVLWVGNGSNFQIENVTFNSYSGVNALCFNGNMRNVTIRDCYFRFERANSSTNYDNSAIYINGRNQIVVNNHFYADVSQRARGAIETHSGVSVVSGNVTNGFMTGVNIVSPSTGDTWTGENDITVTGNVISNANTGISLWSCTDQKLSNVTIANNTISLINADHNSNRNHGIAMIAASGDVLNGSYDNINISNNAIKFQKETAVRENQSESTTYAIGIAPNGNVSHVNITGNIITDAPLKGIQIGLKEDYICNNIRVKGNTIVNAGCNRFAENKWFRCAVFLTGNLDTVAIENNSIYDDNDVFSGFLSIYTVGGNYNAVSVKNNAISSRQGGYYFNVADNIDIGPKVKTHYSAYPVTEKMTLNAGDIIINTGALSVDGYCGYRVTQRGTTGTLTGVTASTVAGSTAITVNDSADIATGDFIKVGSIAVKVLQITGNTILTNQNFTDDKENMPVTYIPPVCKPFGLISD